MIEENIIKAFISKRECYNRFSKYYSLDFVKLKNPILFRIHKTIALFWDKTDKEVGSIDDLELLYHASYPILKEADRVEVNNTFSNIKQAVADEENIIKFLEVHRNRALAANIAVKAMDVAEGRAEAVELVDMTSQLGISNLVVEEVLDEASTDIEDILQAEEDSPGLNWRLDCLNVSLGPIRKGNFGHIFARIETGKTAMWVSEATYMAPQLKDNEVVAIFFNEENKNDVIIRLYSAMLRKTYGEIIADPKKAKADFMRLGGERIKFFDRAQLHKTEVENILTKVNPGLIIIDNMDKLKGFTADRPDLVLWDIYKWGRKMAKEICPILSVGQADATADGRKWINENQMDGGKTGKPSETDFTIGIGRTREDGYEFIRYIHISRNKLKGGKDTKSFYRHGKFDVLLKPEYSLYEDIHGY